jgi:hypothetical protein
LAPFLISPIVRFSTHHKTRAKIYRNSQRGTAFIFSIYGELLHTRPYFEESNYKPVTNGDSSKEKLLPLPADFRGLWVPDACRQTYQISWGFQSLSPGQ